LVSPVHSVRGKRPFLSHLYTATGETEQIDAVTGTPKPSTVVLSERIGVVSMAQIKPQVNYRVKQGLVEPSNGSIDNPGMTHPLGKIIKDRLKSLKKTQGWLAEQANVSDTAVSKWIATGKISRGSAMDVSRILGISIDTLLGSAAALNELPASLSLIYVDADELRLLTAYRESTPLGKALISAAADGAPRNESLEIVMIRHKS
jgi:hypothetical protein